MNTLPMTFQLDLPTLENWLWEAACVIRGPVDAPKFKDYILPLIFLKHLSDVFEDELEYLAEVFRSRAEAERLVEKDHKVVRFYLPPEARWDRLRQQTSGLGQYLTDAMWAVARENPKLHGAIDRVDFNVTASGQRILDDATLKQLIEVLSRHRLGLKEVEPDILGWAYEYLLRKFAEGQGQSAGEFYTPCEVGILMARLLKPQPGMEVYDPCCGSGGLLIKRHLRLLETHEVMRNGRRELTSDVPPLRLYGQEINPDTYAIAKINAVLHELEADIRLGNTMVRPAFLDPDGRLKQFDLVVANPMWNQRAEAFGGPEIYENDPYGRFRYGAPPASSADWGWLQHMLASLKDGGRMAVVLDTGAVSRDSGNQGSNREWDIRRRFVEADLIEAVILLPENLFYNTTAPGIILVVNKAKRHPGEILLVNASRLFAKGRPKNYLTEEHIAQVTDLYHQGRAEPGLSTIIAKEETTRNDYSLSPNRYAAVNSADEVLPLEEALVLLRAAAEQEPERALHQLRIESIKGGHEYRHIHP